MGMKRSASMPHITIDVQKKKTPDFFLNKKVKQYALPNSYKFTILVTLLACAGIIIPFTISWKDGDFSPKHSQSSGNDSAKLKRGITNASLVMAAFFGSLMASIRFVQVASQNEINYGKIDVLNKIGVLCGYICFAGFVILAFFPPNSVPGTPHLQISIFNLGSFLSIYFGGMYITIETAISLFYYQKNILILAIRTLIFILSIISFIIYSLTSADVKTNDNGLNIYLKPGDIRIENSQRDEEKEIVINISKWAMIYLFAAYFLTFVKECQQILVVVTFRQWITGRLTSVSSTSNMNKI